MTMVVPIRIPNAFINGFSNSSKFFLISVTNPVAINREIAAEIPPVASSDIFSSKNDMELNVFCIDDSPIKNIIASINPNKTLLNNDNNTPNRSALFIFEILKYIRYIII
jgi:hypothetical protein